MKVGVCRNTKCFHSFHGSDGILSITGSPQVNSGSKMGRGRKIAVVTRTHY